MAMLLKVITVLSAIIDFLTYINAKAANIYEIKMAEKRKKEKQEAEKDAIEKKNTTGLNQFTNPDYKP